MGGKKTVVISDVHISNGAEYAWFSSSDSDNLTFLLNSICMPSAEVEELVFLGDLFDLWLYPVDVLPWTVDKIIDANRPVKEAIRECVKTLPAVHYLNGNHDMSVTQEDLKPFSFGQEKTIYKTDTEDFKEKHRGMWHFEHGHEADMFNAKPGEDENTIGGYPLGYFLTRLTVGAHPGIWQTLQKICQSFFKAQLIGIKAEKLWGVDILGSAFVKTLIEGIQRGTSIKDSTRIRFNEPDLDKQYTVGDIKEHYGDLLNVWFKKYPGMDLFRSMFASQGFNGGLDWYADEILASDNPPELVVMGHTHEFVVGKNGYSNDGAFCGSANLACVEILNDKVAVMARLVTDGR